MNSTQNKNQYVRPSKLTEFMLAEEYKYIHYREGHKNSDGDDAPWVITQKGTGKVLSSHTSEQAAKDAFQAMMAHKHA